MVPNREAIKDILDLLQHGFRRTPAGYKRRELRRSRFTVIYENQGIRIQDNWRRYDLLFWVPLGHMLLVNTDRTSAYYHHEIWRWLCQWHQEAVPVSFGAAQLAGINLSTIRPVVHRPPWHVEHRVTKPDDTPSWVKYAGYGYVDGQWQAKYRDPEPDGFFHWTHDKWQGQPEGVFRATYLRRGHPGDAMFLSGWDENDHPARYFLAQLPDEAIRQPPRSMDEAREILMPVAVKLAREQGLRYVRQGDVFAIETEATTKELEEKLRHRTRYAKWLRGSFQKFYCSCGDRHCYSYFQARPPAGAAPTSFKHEHWSLNVFDAADRAEYAQKLQIHGTVHTATEVITLEDGTQYARGQLVHQPLLGQPNRPRDHHNVPLDGGKWWLLVRNTVPQA